VLLCYAGNPNLICFEICNMHEVLEAAMKIYICVCVCVCVCVCIYIYIYYLLWLRNCCVEVLMKEVCKK
jgi:hypothetical protein